ncbi:MAG: oligosaccharide flippase family protein [Chloroflexota bacterium]
MTARLRQLLRSKFIQDTLVLQAGKFSLILLSLISSVLVWRLLGPEGAGIFALGESLLNVWQSLDLTGVGTSVSVSLAIAIGANDNDSILDLLAFYVKVSLLVNVLLTVLIVVFGMLITDRFYGGDTRIVSIAILLSVGSLADAGYGMVMMALRSRRSMRTFALLQNANQLVLTACMIAAVLIRAEPESLAVGRLVYSYATLLLAYVVYQRTRTHGQVSYPTLRAIFTRAITVSPRRYWRFGIANAIDKNITSLFVQIPLQLVGSLAGAQAVGYLDLALSGITQAGTLTSAVLDNMQAVVPQAVGRGDYAGLWRNFRRVLVIMTLISLALYGLLALLAPFAIPPVLGSRWIPAIPPLVILTLYGAITTVGGNFSPLYRSFNLMRQTIIVKLIALALVVPIGLVLMQAAVARDVSGSSGAVAGAWMLTVIYALSITLTAVVTLPELRRRAATPVADS